MMVSGQSQTCYDFTVGKCTRGVGCRFEHADVHVPSSRGRDEDREDRGRDDRRRRDGPRESSTRRGGSSQCYDFTQNKCDRGASCKFEHPETCYDFSIGQCSRDDCRFVHADVHTRKSGVRGAIRTTSVPPPGFAPIRRDNRDNRDNRSDTRGRQDTRRPSPPRHEVRNNRRGGAESGDVCYDFTVGDCTRGDGCKFVHPETCFDASVGKCDRGDRCRFLHQGPHNRKEARGGAPRGGARERRDATPLRACFDFTQDRCTRGDSCKFSHGEAEDERQVDIIPEIDEGETCYDFSVGKCTRGSGCRFIHDADKEHVPRSKKRAAPY